MDAHLDINDPILLLDDADRSYRSRVEDLAPGLITVAAPLDLPAEHGFGPGVEMLVTWGCARGIAVLPVRILDAHIEGGLVLWSMAITRDGWVEQRRRFVRVPAHGPLTLVPRSERTEDVVAVTGHLVEVSEAALRCAVDTEAADDILVHGIEVTADFRYGDREFAIAARIGFRRPSEGPTEHADIVVVFDEPVTDADALRKQIFAQQLRALRPARRRS